MSEAKFYRNTCKESVNEGKLVLAKVAEANGNFGGVTFSTGDYLVCSTPGGDFFPQRQDTFFMSHAVVEDQAAAQKEFESGFDLAGAPVEESAPEAVAEPASPFDLATEVAAMVEGHEGGVIIAEAPLAEEAKPKSKGKAK